MFAFDLLYFDGHDIRSLELTARRYFLQSLLKDEQGAIRLSEEIEGDGREIFAAACEHGSEGIIAKYKSSPYRSGRLGEWVKVKCVQSDSFIVVGYEHSMVAPSGIGSLLLGARKGDDWVYVGSVGTGFNERSSDYLRETQFPRPPFSRFGNKSAYASAFWPVVRSRRTKPSSSFPGKRAALLDPQALQALIALRRWLARIAMIGPADGRGR
jgi:ATP-dependent DNA ligase